MPIHVPDDPPGGRELVRQNVMLRQQGEMNFALAETPVAIGLSPPVYTATRQGLLRGEFLTSARLAAWHYIVGPSDAPNGLAELTETNAKDQPPLSYAALYPGVYAKEILAVIADAETLPQVAAGHYELRILRAPSLSLLAVWLHGDDDLIFPVRGPKALKIPDTEQLRRIVNEAELVEALRPLAEQRMAVSDRG